MKFRTITVTGLIALSGLILADRSKAGGDEGGTDYSKLLTALPLSQHSLAEVIRQAPTTAPETAISAKFELDDNGNLSLSVYTAELGLGVGAEENVLKELAAGPESDIWYPEVEIFKDPPHVSRAWEQLTLMSLSPSSLLEMIDRAECDQAGTVFSITPVVQNRQAQFVILVADKDQVVELRYDLLTGTRILPPLAATQPERAEK